MGCGTSKWKNKPPENNALLKHIGNRVYEIRKKEYIVTYFFQSNMESGPHNLYQRHQRRILCNIALPNIRIGNKTPQRLYHNHQGKKNRRNQERLINTPRFTNKILPWNNYWTQTSMRKLFLHQGHPNEQKNIQQPNGILSSQKK